MIKVRYKFLWSAILIFIVSWSTSTGFTLSDAHDPNVRFEVVKQAYYKLYIDENVANVTLCNIALDDESEKVQVDLYNLESLCNGYVNGQAINPKDSTNAALVLNKPLDYEQNNCQDFKTYLTNTATTQTLEIIVGNIDDNPPQLILPHSKCTVKENAVYNKKNTDCIITMTDADGLMNGTTFKLAEGSTETLFDVGFQKEPDYQSKDANVVIFLKAGHTLDYETRNLYILNLEAQEQITNNSIQVVIDVIDMPDQPPKWLSMFTTKQFEENINQKFSVQAIDGDVGINNDITYSIAKNGCDEYSCKINIDDKGNIEVENVDREEVKDTLSLTIEAIEKCENKDEGNQTSLSITFFIQDQNDNSPKIEFSNDKYVFEIEENFKGSISTFTVADMDLGTNGSYEIKMAVDKGSVDYTKAFQVIPIAGYQKGDFTLTVYDSSKLDFEDKVWANIAFKLIAVEKANDKHVDSKLIKINLLDVNDESPIFVNNTDAVSVLESIGKGEKIFDATATDADEGDIVTYEILGVLGEKLDISKNGIITPKQDNVFDYEQLQQVVVQIKASDTNYHNTFKTLTINVIDVDDEPPSIRTTTSKSRISIKENSPTKTEADALIIVTDPDTKPKLKIEIDWSKSTITKNSADVTADADKWQCFDVVEDDHPENAQKISAKIVVNDKCSPDFELFDAIIISLTATDDNNIIEPKTATATILINIEDINDNPPEFTTSSITGLQISDGTKDVTKIGIVSAYDVDLNEKITFSITPVDSNPDWVDIDEETGQLTVKEDVTIDDDVPVRYNISYIVTAYDNDQTHKTDVQVDIYVVDVNDQTPKISASEAKISIDEESESGLFVTNISAVDKDRDDPFNKLVFKFGTNITNDAANRFAINEVGRITVELKNGATLDREGGASQYVLPVRVYDNPKGALQLSDNFDLTVTLNDINDNPPIIKETSLKCSENLKKGETLGKLHAEDPDEEGPNSQANFEITNVQQVDGKKLPRKLTKNFFDISSDDYKIATISLKEDLRDYFGNYTLTIKTWDNGKPRQHYDNKIKLEITKFNFEEPIFQYPSDGENIILSKDQYPVDQNKELVLYNNDNLKDFVVDDQQNCKWAITFKIISEDGGKQELFTLSTLSNNKTKLQLTRALSEEDTSKNHTITIEASVKSDKQKDEAQTSVQIKLNIFFFNENDEPKFTEKTVTISFKENEKKLEHDIPQATFNVDLKDLSPSYFMMTESDTFDVDIDKGTISVIKELDFETQNDYQFVIAASSKSSRPTNPSQDSTLQIEIKVEDVNEYPPVFFPSQFFGAFLKSFTKQSTIVTVNATDEDGSDAGNLHFSLSEDSINCTGKISLPKNPFLIGEKDGKISPSFLLTSDMSGFCIITVSAKDNEDKYNTVHSVPTTVQINIISDDELVTFTFINTDSELYVQQENIMSKIDDIFKKYDYKSYLADFTFDHEYRNTTSHFYFLHDNLPVKASLILGNLTDIDNFTRLKKSLADIEIILSDFSADNSTKYVEDYLKIWLIVTTCVLATLLILLAVILFFRNRALTRRIKNLSTTKFGSQESGLNRAGVAAPTTNRNAIEGSNPIFNSENYIKEVEPDRNSIISSDSDLFGVEENPEFQT